MLINDKVSFLFFADERQSFLSFFSLIKDKFESFLFFSLIKVNVSFFFWVQKNNNKTRPWNISLLHKTKSKHIITFTFRWSQKKRIHSSVVPVKPRTTTVKPRTTTTHSSLIFVSQPQISFIHLSPGLSRGILFYYYLFLCSYE